MDSRKLDKNECSNKNDIFSDILKEGFLTKQAENWRTWRTRYFILFKDGKLLGYDSDKSTNLGKLNLGSLNNVNQPIGLQFRVPRNSSPDSKYPSYATELLFIKSRNRVLSS